MQVKNRNLGRPLARLLPNYELFTPSIPGFHGVVGPDPGLSTWLTNYFTGYQREETKAGSEFKLQLAVFGEE